MSDHRSVKLGLGGRRRIVEAVEGGMTQRPAAARFCVSPATVNRWVMRARGESGAARAGRLLSIVPAARTARRGCCRRPTRPCLRGQAAQRLGPAADRLGALDPHATVHRALSRRGCSRRPRAPRAAVQRYEWPCPGNLLHMDTKRYQRFERPGHAVTGDRTVKSRGAGHEFAHSIVDDCSRLAYSELHDDERADTVTAFTERALDWLLDTASSASGS